MYQLVKIPAPIADAPVQFTIDSCWRAASKKELLSIGSFLEMFPQAQTIDP
jgi:hypothetical protein